MPSDSEINKRELASDFLSDLIEMDLGLAANKGISIESGIVNLGLDSITFIWQENIVKDRMVNKKFFDHMDEYPNGFFVQAIKLVAEQWIAMKKLPRKKVYKDFGLLE